MANFTRQRASGLWVPGSVILQEECEEIDDIRPKLINAADGSTHAPSSQIDIGGSGLRVSGPSRLDSLTLGALAATGTLTVTNNSTLVVEGGVVGGLIRLDTGAVPGRIDLDGASTELRVKSGAFITVQVGAALDLFGGTTLKSTGTITTQSGSTVIMNSGATWTLSGDVFFASSTWPKLSPARTWQRRSLLIATPTYDSVSAGMPIDPNSVKVQIVGGGDRIITRSTDRTSDYTLIEFPDVPEGQEITQVEITCIGNGPGTLGMTFPQYQLMRWRGTSKDVLSALISDTHVLGNWDTTPISTTIPVSVPAFKDVDHGYHYGLMIHHAYYAGSPSGTGYFYNAIMTGTATDMRV